MPDIASASAPPTKKLGEILVDAGLITTKQLGKAVEESRQQQKRLGDYLQDEGMVAAEDVALALSLQLNLPIIDLTRQQVQPEALALVPEEYARQHDLIPVDVTGDSLVVVMADPLNMHALEDLRARARKIIQPAVGIPSDIREAINRNYVGWNEIERQISMVAPRAAEVAVEEIGPGFTAQTPIVRTAELLIAQAVRDRASDIHLEPKETRLRVRYRIDGFLHEVQTLPLSVHPALISRLKVLAGMNIAERRRPQDGQFSVSVEGKDVDFRVATSDSAHGEMMVLRVLDKSLSLIALKELGFLPEALEHYTQMLRKPFGMVLVGGPTGSGKTTTLYASLNQLDRKGRNIVTIEDPIEYHFEDINQIQVNALANITFASGLRSIMRLDPDVILVGEVRDGETAAMATQASLTGHLVLSSIHANDAVGILFRLIDLGVEPFLISSALVGVISQRLVRRVCSHCRELADVPAEEASAYEEELGEKPEKLYYGSGCNFCANTGYAGRTGVYEVMALSEEIRRLLLKGAGSADIKAQALSEGMVAMRRSAMLKVQQGVTTPHEVIRNVYSIM
ncbi:MAG TPA: GspE/PulE family protein [Dehalococcoidia bacterium]|nr:GspE/PulE family protein [Dehalococcoidia bacterium]